MKNHYFYVFLILLLITGCNSNINTPADSSKYPTGLYNQWEYSTVYKTIYYDSNGIPVDSTEQNTGNTIVLVAGINQNIDSTSNLILFESYEAATPAQIAKDWYLNSDSGFYAIAYVDAGSAQPVIPKTGVHLSHLNSIWSKHVSLMPAYDYSDKKYADDSVLYYYTPRQVLAYPLEIGKRWIELIAPFYRERYINTTENVLINNVTFNCIVVEADMENYQFKMIDDISPEFGLIRRTIIDDSLAYTNPDGKPTGMYEKIISVSTLVNKNF